MCCSVQSVRDFQQIQNRIVVDKVIECNKNEMFGEILWPQQQKVSGVQFFLVFSLTVQQNPGGLPFAIWIRAMKSSLALEFVVKVARNICYDFQNLLIFCIGSCYLPLTMDLNIIILDAHVDRHRISQLTKYPEDCPPEA